MFGSFPVPLTGAKKYSLKSQTFTANGTFYVPSNIVGNAVLLYGSGGGGSGASDVDTTCMVTGGGSGFWCQNYPYIVSPGSAISVVVGPGGTATTGDSNGNNGTASSFGTLSLAGGQGGTRATALNVAQLSVAYGGCHGGKYLSPYAGTVIILDMPQSSPYYAAGTSIVSDNNYILFGGGAGLFGVGANANSGSAGSNAGANTGAGGAGGITGGGAGGSGKWIVYWWEYI